MHYALVNYILNDFFHHSFDVTLYGTAIKYFIDTNTFILLSSAFFSVYIYCMLKWYQLLPNVDVLKIVKSY